MTKQKLLSLLVLSTLVLPLVGLAQSAVSQPGTVMPGAPEAKPGEAERIKERQRLFERQFEGKPMLPGGPERPVGDEKKAAVKTEILGRRLEQTKLKFNHAVAVLENLIGRVESRVAKMAAAGKDVSKAKTALTEVKNLTGEAKTALQNLLNQNLTDKPLAEIKAALRVPMEQLREARRKLVEIIRGLVAAAKVNQTVNQ